MHRRSLHEYPQIKARDNCLRKRPVPSATGTLGVRLIVDAEVMAALRRTVA